MSPSIGKVSRDAMHAHIFASPSGADELTKHLTELNGFRSMELEDAGRDRGTEEEFGTEMPRESQRCVVELGVEKFGAMDLVKLECGGVVRADGEVLDGKLIRVNTPQMIGEVRINFPAGRETNQVREHLLPSLAAKPARFEGRCSLFTLTRLPFCLLLDTG